MFIELLWVADLAEAQAEGPARRMRRPERRSKRTSGAGKFGIGLRPTGDSADDAPFPTWEYQPAHLPDPLAIHIGTNSDVVTEPLLFYLPFGRRADRDEPARRQPRDHPAGMREISSLGITRVDSGDPSAALRSVGTECRWLSFACGDYDLLELGFDGRHAGESADFRPELPVVVRW